MTCNVLKTEIRENIKAICIKEKKSEIPYFVKEENNC